MKKIVAIIVCCVASLSFSATVTWGTEGTVTGPSGEAFTSGYMYLVSVPTGAGAPSYTSGTWNMNGGSLLTAATYDNATSTWTVVAQQLTLPTAGNDYYLVFSTMTESVSDLANLALESKFLVSSTPGDVTIAADSTGGGNDQFTIFWEDVTGTWTTVSGVPEPTVLALLVLGVAGLALRRRAR